MKKKELYNQDYESAVFLPIWIERSLAIGHIGHIADVVPRRVSEIRPRCAADLQLRSNALWLWRTCHFQRARIARQMRCSVVEWWWVCVISRRYFAIAIYHRASNLYASERLFKRFVFWTASADTLSAERLRDTLWL
jgi:hypothetical protein